MAKLLKYINCYIVPLLILFVGLPAISEENLILVDFKDVSKYWEVKKPRRTKQNPERIPIFRVKLTAGEKSQLNKLGCVGIAYIIGANGRTQDIRVISAFPDDKLVKYNVKLVESVRYTPVESNVERQPVYTSVVQVTPSASREASENAEVIREREVVASICQKDIDKYIQKLAGSYPSQQGK